MLEWKIYAVVSLKYNFGENIPETLNDSDDFSKIWKNVIESS